MIPLILVGASGRMGRAVEAAALEAGGFRIKARFSRSGALSREGSGSGEAGYGLERPGAGQSSVRDALLRCAVQGDVIVDFSRPEACRDTARACAERGAALVTGTTGLGPEDERALAEAARRVAVLRAANFSLGIVALRRAVAAALRALPEDWDIEIVERHHRRKVDSPSGTALLIANEVAGHRGGSEVSRRSGREGAAGPRPRDEIGIHSVRGGTWVGDHAVLLAGTGESLEIRHVAEDRSAFAHGALRAARFVASAPPGLYALEDVLSSPGRG